MIKHRYYPGLSAHKARFKVGLIRRSVDNKVAFLTAHYRSLNALRTWSLQLRRTGLRSDASKPVKTWFARN